MTSSFSDKGRAAVLDRWLRFHLWNRDYISGASRPHIILNYSETGWKTLLYLSLSLSHPLSIYLFIRNDSSGSISNLCCNYLQRLQSCINVRLSVWVMRWHIIFYLLNSFWYLKLVRFFYQNTSGNQMIFECVVSHEYFTWVLLLSLVEAFLLYGKSQVLPSSSEIAIHCDIRK